MQALDYQLKNQSKISCVKVSIFNINWCIIKISYKGKTLLTEGGRGGVQMTSCYVGWDSMTSRYVGLYSITSCMCVWESEREVGPRMRNSY